MTIATPHWAGSSDQLLWASQPGTSTSTPTRGMTRKTGRIRLGLQSLQITHSKRQRMQVRPVLLELRERL